MAMSTKFTHKWIYKNDIVCNIPWQNLFRNSTDLFKLNGYIIHKERERKRERAKAKKKRKKQYRARVHASDAE